jgi:FKBP-type peptidyl-prolyl cis-trans isomerase FkpA
MNAVYSTQNDSVIFSTYTENMGPFQQTVSAPTFNGDPMEGYVMLGEGDSAIFLMPADSAFKNQPYPPFAKKGDYIKIGVSVLSIMSKEQYDNKKLAEAKLQTDMERATIEEYLAKNNLTAQQTASGLYYVVEKQGDGKRAQSGDSVTVNYTGKLLDGTVFDSSLNPGRTPLTFPLGAGRVIKGWDEGIALFNVGGKGILIIPSPLGWGTHASGLIPANSVTIFDIELLKVE